MMKRLLREEAKTLRESGYSYTYIQKKTGVSKGTLSCWLARVPYTPNAETVRHIGLARAKSTQAKHRLKLETFERAREKAEKDIGTLSNRDIFMLGLGLYLGEGTKTHSIVRVINANPDIIRLAILWFIRSCGLSMNNFSIRLHLYPDNDVQKSIRYWARVTGLRVSQFHKVHIDHRKDKRVSKRGKLPYGTAHLSVRSLGNKEHGVVLSRVILAWIDEVIDRAGMV